MCHDRNQGTHHCYGTDTYRPVTPYIILCIFTMELLPSVGMNFNSEFKQACSENNTLIHVRVKHDNNMT